MKMSAYETNALPPGSTVKHYTVVDLLGFDHQGCLYRAECADTEFPVLLYEYLPAGLAIRGAHGVQSLPGKAEALSKAVAAYATRLRAAGLVGHPALPALDDIWSQGATVYAVGPLRPGRSLMTALASGGHPDAPSLSRWVRALCDALSALHRNDLVHGNLSPSMMRVLDSGELQLPLVGAGLFDHDTPAWIAPEQHPLNPRPVGVGNWTDVYQLSALVHHLMTGQAPPAVMRRWEGAPLERLADLGDRFSADMLVATHKGLSMLASARPQTAERWLAMAGLPERRRQPRDDQTELTPELSAMRRSEHHDEDSTVRAALMAVASPGSGHQPLPAGVQARLDRLDSQRQSNKMTWLWASLMLGIATLIAVVAYT